jgi:hypothetical protein
MSTTLERIHIQYEKSYIPTTTDRETCSFSTVLLEKYYKLHFRCLSSSFFYYVDSNWLHPDSLEFVPESEC